MIRPLVVAPLPPPIRGGITNWARIVRGYLAGHPDVVAHFLDTSVRWRRETNLALAARLVGGSIQAVRDAARLRRALRRERPSVVHLCTSGGLAVPKDMLMLTAARRANVPSVLHCHFGTLPATIARGGLGARLVRRAARLATRVVVLDAASEEALRRAVPEAAVLRLPNMVELDAVDHPDPTAPPLPPPLEGASRIVFVGHIVPTKGVRELVEACLGLGEIPWVLDLVGTADPTFRGALRAMAAAAGRELHVRFQGYADHPRVLQFLRAADLFVLPSYTEGAPNVVLEAMACGRATLATTVGAIPEMLDSDGPEPCGQCVPPRDAPALREAMAALLCDPARRGELGRRGRRRAEEHYSVPVACGKLVDFWESLAPGPCAGDATGATLPKLMASSRDAGHGRRSPQDRFRGRD